MTGLSGLKRVIVLISALLPGLAVAQESPVYQASRWVNAASARVRLILPATPTAAASHGAVEIVLPADAKTYWRNPGETGVPTTARFDGSTGLSGLVLDFPVPVAFDDGAGGTAIGYTGSVTLPIRFTPTGGEAKLAVALEFGICTKNMCIPAEANLSLKAGAGDTLPELNEIVRKARAAVPVVRPPGVREGVGIASATRGMAEGKIVLDVLARVSEGDTAPALFVDAADSYEVKRLGAVEGGIARFRATSGSAPEAGKPLGEVRLTLSSAEAATETKLNLDELAAAP